MGKVDLKQELKHLYSSSAKAAEIVQVPAMNCLAIDGQGDPGTSAEYRQAVETLYGLSYALKFLVKKSADGIDYGVMPLEGLWWMEDMAQFSMENRDVWQWTAMIMQPEFITADLLEAALEDLKIKKKTLPAIDKMRFIRWEEGLAAQIMHIGPYAAEAPTIVKLHDFIAEQGYLRAGKHHEIYLSDPRKSAPEKMKTILRQPMARS